MKARSSGKEHGDLFLQPLRDMVAPGHPLVLLSRFIDWKDFEQEWAGFFPSDTGHPALPTRFVAGNMYLQHANRMSDEAAVRMWSENPYWQYFCGMEHWQRRPPMDASSLVHWRQRIGWSSAELLLKKMMSATRWLNLVVPKVHAKALLR